MSNPLNGRSYYIELAQKTAELNPTSYQRLLNELIKSGVSDENARYGLDNCDVDWNRQALRAVEYYKHQADYGDILIEKYLVDRELFTSDQAKAGLELYYQENNISRLKALDFYKTTTVRYIDTTISILDSGDYEIKSRFSVSSTEKCVIEFGVCYFNDYKEEIDFSYNSIKTKVEPGESIATIIKTIPSVIWETPEYLAMTKGTYFNRDDMIEINIAK